jgi:integrase
MAKPKTSFRFTAAAVDRIRPPEAGRVDYSNTAIPGMQLRVSAAQPGKEPKRIYRVKTRIGGKQVPMTLGSAAVLSLAEASKRAREFLSQASAGVNLVEQRRNQEAEEKAAESVQMVFARYLAEYALAHMRPDYYKETERALRVDVMPMIGDMRIDQLTKAKIRSAVIGPIVARGRRPQAAHVLRYLRAFLSWAQREDLITVNPALGIPDPDTRKREDRERERWLDDSEIPLFWAACDDAGCTFAPFFQLLLLFGCRRDELAHATWSEFDLEKQTWILPGRRSKNGNDHVTHIADPAIEILGKLPRLRSSDPNEFLFSTTGHTPASGFHHALARVIAAMSAAAGREIAHFTIHDLRRSTATGMAELGVSEHVVDRVLNHSSGRKVSGVARIYNRSEYLPARQAALELWARHIEGLAGLAPRTPDNVVDLPTVRAGAA